MSNKDPHSFPDPNAPGHTLLERDCSPWKAATHPDGALYFYDLERVRH
jgi:hypothetical protein